MNIPNDTLLSPALALVTHAGLQQQGNLCIWTIYAHPSDYPADFVARLFTQHGRTDMILTADSLGGLRGQLPPGLTCLMREPNDDPVIVESWV
jgi:hypothetical protein